MAPRTKLLIDDILELMYALRNIIMKQAASCRGIDISTHLQLHALSFISQEGPVTMRELAKFMAVTAASATALADRLVRHGFIKRITSPEDRRTVRVEITEKGRKHLRRHTALVHRHMSSVIGRLSERSRRNLISVLEELRSIYTNQ